MFPPLTLRIRRKRPTAIRTLAPGDSQPAQVFHHRLRKLRLASLRIKILVAEDQRTLTLPRPFGRDPERPRMTDM